MRLLDPRFKYIPAARTDVAETWRRFGFRPTTDAERRSRKTQGADGTADEGPPAGLAPQRRRRADVAKLAASE